MMASSSLMNLKRVSNFMRNPKLEHVFVNFYVCWLRSRQAFGLNLSTYLQNNRLDTPSYTFFCRIPPETLWLEKV